MKTEETITNVCKELGIAKSELAKRMGMLPSSLYRKLARESMTLEELERCLEVLGVTIEFNLTYPDGNVRSSQINHEKLLERAEILKTELEATRKATEYHKRTLRDLRTDLNSAVGYTELGTRHTDKADEYLKKIQDVLTNMESTIAYTLGEESQDEQEDEMPENLDMLAGKRVLLVEDNEINREIMREILLEHSLLVEEAENGSEAVANLQAKDAGYYHFIVMDIEMPVMDGYESTMRIRKLPNRIRANIPVIALTANAFPEDREKAAAVGMDDFLVKPVNSNRLLSSLARFL